jgi:hypothetical protein
MSPGDQAAKGAPARLVARVIVIVGAANLAAELLIYGALIVPSVEEGERVPAWMWALMYAPVLAASVWASRGIARVSEVVVAGVAAGCVAQLEKWALAVLGAAGHAEGLAAVAPATFWGPHFARMTLGFVVLFAIIAVVSRAAKRPTPPA